MAKETINKMEGNLPNGKKYLQIIGLTRGQYEKYRKNPYNLTVKKKKKKSV